MGDRLWAGIPSRYVTSQLGLALHPSGVAKWSTSFGCGKGWNVTFAGWQVTLCDSIWQVSSSSGVATSVSELLYPCYFTLLYLLIEEIAKDQPSINRSWAEQLDELEQKKLVHPRSLHRSTRRRSYTRPKCRPEPSETVRNCRDAARTPSGRRPDTARSVETGTRMWANAQPDGRPAEHIGGALCSTPQSLANAHY